MIPVIGFVGYSNSGKTTVVSSLVKILGQRGYKVAAIKHAAHGYEMDSPGSDSWQHYAAGAEKVIVVGPDSFTMHQRCQEPPRLADIIAIIDNVDLILVEGFKGEPGPKIEVIRQEYSKERVALDDKLIAIITDNEIDCDEQCFSFEELDLVADFLLEKFLPVRG